jgi:hypothetical protein
MAWYHTFNKKVNSGNSADIEKAFNEMMENIPLVPKIMRADQFYSKKYFSTRVKPTIDAEWALIMDNAPKGTRIILSNNITHHIYCNETKGFKQWLEVEQQEAHLNDVMKREKISR